MSNLIQHFGDAGVLYIIFGITLIFSLLLDAGVLQRSFKPMSLKSASVQTVCWISLAIAYGFLISHYRDTEKGLQYYSAYLMEYSLSADNLFVFILILNYFNISDLYYHKVLFYGIICAVIFRLIFILAGIEMVNNFHWILYFLGGVLIYSGIKILLSGSDQKFNPDKNIIYKFLHRYFPMVKHEGEGNFTIYENGKKYYTVLFVVIILIASTDLVFAIDSIPAVFAISQDRLVIITSNIFAVMGLRAMFFLLKGFADKFDYLQEGISVVLIFVGAKMLLEIFDIRISTHWSLLVIVLVLTAAIVVSLLKNRTSKIQGK
ncbi:MAG: TerC/Alx family metal homeostasis membrane protein [Chitinophagales bacterium]|nr:TerC/Alx family metal homeostasis membrane protein [Chitinophagales bacterium]